MASYAGHDLATGWMPGDARLAALNRGTTGNAVGTANLVTNGDFASGTTGWTFGQATGAVVAGVLEVTATGISGPAACFQAFSVVEGEGYLISLDLERISGRAGANVQLSGSGLSTAVSRSVTEVGTASLLLGFVATATGSVDVTIFEGNASPSAGLAFRVDNVVCRLAAADHSARANGLNVVGTLARNSAATGADIAAWSGFSASNYLEQPYNSALDFGTGDFMLAAWVNLTAVDSTILDRQTSAYGAGAGIHLRTNASGQAILRTLSGASTVATATGTTALTSAGWAQVVAVRRNDVLEVWVNGVREGTVADTTNLTNAAARLRLGLNNNDAQAATGSLALARISAYAPTPAQIARMYRDEVRLFQPGARCFLGGTSSNVRKLSRSRFSGLLAAATPAGVSVFDGLLRTEFQTSATLSPAMASSDVRAVAMEAGMLAIGTVSNAGARRNAIIGLDRMGNTTPTPVPAIRAAGLTINATPLALAPRVWIGERELVQITATVLGRVVGAADGQRLSYTRQATYFRDGGGNVTLQGSVVVLGTDTEVTGTANATLMLDTTAQTVTAQVTGIAATSISWDATFDVRRIVSETAYEETRT